MTNLEWFQKMLSNKVDLVEEGDLVEQKDRDKHTIVNPKFTFKDTDDFNKLNLYAPIPKTLKPCGFYADTLTEAVWLPFENEDKEIAVKPCVLIAKKDFPTKEKPYKIVEFWDKDQAITGTFPSQELNTLMSVKAVQMLECNGNVEPKYIDGKLEEAFEKHLAMPKAEMILCKRWIEGSFFYDVFDAFPIQSILGVSESGKSRLCMVNLALCYHAEGLIDPSEASVFRSKEEDKVSLIIDEAEYLNNPYLYSTLRILLNASYSKSSGYVTRYDEQEGKRIKKRFDLYSPMCISGIAGLEGVTLSRAFRIVMRRTNKDYPKAYSQDYRLLRDCLYVLRIRHCFEIAEIYAQTDISNVVNARFEELFKPLFAMTKFFGNQEEWDILAEWAKEYQENFRLEALNVAEEEMALNALKILSEAPKDADQTDQKDWLKLKELTETINGIYSINHNPKTVSNILYRLGFVKRKKVHGMTLIYANKELIETCAANIGLNVSDFSSQESATNATTSTNSTTLTEAQVTLTEQDSNWLNKTKEVEP